MRQFVPVTGILVLLGACVGPNPVTGPTEAVADEGVELIPSGGILPTGPTGISCPVEGLPINTNVRGWGSNGGHVEIYTRTTADSPGYQVEIYIYGGRPDEEHNRNIWSTTPLATLQVTAEDIGFPPENDLLTFDWYAEWDDRYYRARLRSLACGTWSLWSVFGF